MNGTGRSEPIPRWRLLLTYGAMLVLLSLFVGRLYQLQVIDQQEYALAAEDNRLNTVNVPAPRGVIYDRNGTLLVRNIPVYNVNVTTALLPDSDAEQQSIYQTIAQLTGVPLDQEGPPAAKCVPGRGIIQLVEEGASLAPYSPWPVACDIGEAAARVLRQLQVDMPGVEVEAVPVRDYVTGETTAAAIGYLGPIPAADEQAYRDLGFDPNRDKVGYAGIEGNYQSVLAGANGRKVVEVDVAGQQIREVGEVVQPTPGNSLQLTIDTRLQTAAETALRNRMEFMNRFNPYGPEDRVPLAALIAINPQTGEVLSMVTLPTYENNRLARFIPFDYYQELEGNERGNPLVNHAIASEFPPGSTFKIVTATGALNEGVVTANQTLFDPGKITITNTYFPNDPGKAKDFVCWKEDGHGDVDFVHGIAYSCNVYFYKIGGGYQDEVPNDGLGIDRLGQYARALGYGAPLGIDLPAEQNGLIPDEEYKRINLGESWSTGDTYNSVVGQGFVGATPLQVLNAISTIANGGRVMWPHLVSDILDGEGNVIQHFDPCMLWNLADDIITPIDQIGAGCPNVPDSVRESRRSTGSPDIQVSPEVIQKVQEGMRLVVSDPDGTAHDTATLETISSAGKTGTGEFCDEVAQQHQLCEPGNWPTHSWYVGYAPFENPEIAVVAFIYNGGEGAITAAPVVRQVMEAYFQLKAIDVAALP
jgi:penicillin-binding protein 2